MPRSSRDLRIPDLCTAIRASRQALEKPRRNHYKMVERYAGAHWGPDRGPVKDDPVNLIGLYVSVVSRSLVARSPRAMLSTFDPSQTAAVAAMQDWLNAELERADYGSVYQRAVLTALFSLSIGKTGIATPADAAVKSWGLQAGMPFLETVSLDDFAWDLTAKDFTEASWYAHFYRRPIDAVKDSKLYNAKALRSLEPTEPPRFTEVGDERSAMLGRGWVTNDEGYEKQVDLVEVYLPRDGIVVTLPGDYVAGVKEAGDGAADLGRKNWIGHERGPYDLLGYGVVPDAAMPKAPVQDLFYLHQALNRSVRKAVRSVDDLKEFTAVRGQADADGGRLVQVNSGDVVRFDDPEGMKQFVSGGQVIQAAVGMAQQLKLFADLIGGNMEVLGGRSSVAKTAHQEELLNQNAAAGIQDLQDATLKFVSSTLRKLCWYWWYHPTAVHRSKYEVAGLPEYGSVRKIHPFDPKNKKHVALHAMGELTRRGLMPAVSVDPYSMGHATPESRVADLDQFMTQIFVPLAPLMQQQGILLDMHAYLKKRAFYRNMPDLPEILSMQAPPSPDGQTGSTGGQDQPPMPTSTNRTYTRRNQSEATPQGQGMNAVNSLLSGKATGGNPNTNGKPAGVA